MKNKYMGAALGALAAIILVSLLFTICFDIFGLGSRGQTVSIEIQSGETLKDAAVKLKQSGAVHFKLVFQLMAKISGEGARLQKGIHTVDKHASYFEMLNELNKTPQTDNFVTIPEGYEFKQIAGLLADKEIVDYDTFIEMAQNEPFDYWFLEGIKQRQYRLEGYLFPDTYVFDKHTDEKLVLETMLNRFEEMVPRAQYEEKANELGYSFDEMITLAAIIEREAGAADKGLVSSVFHNRLKSSEYQNLQSCATVQYILGERKTVLSIADTQIDSPYNTYIVKGLPEGPISMPGKESIDAAFNPPDTDYYFFVVGEDGNHIFSKTYEEHLKAMGQ